MDIAFLASGSLGYKILKSSSLNNRICFVMTDSKSEQIIEYCQENFINYFVGNPRNKRATEFLTNNKADYLFSINYLFIVEVDVLQSIKNYCINFHGSLLPKYRGRTPHIWAIINNEKFTGVTAHLMTANCDEGDIVYQHKIAISDSTTGGELLETYTNLYPTIIDKVIELIQSNSIEFFPQNNSYATWYGKRTPEDGQINWHWQKERIFNWVRAQAFPYPGSFTYLNKKKVFVNSISYSEWGFNNNVANGTILRGGEKPIIKTPNGAITLEHFISDGDFEFYENEVLI